MTVLSLYPNASASPPQGSFGEQWPNPQTSPATNPTTLWAVLSDKSDTTFTEYQAEGPIQDQNSYLQLSFPNPTLPALSQIRSVDFVLRMGVGTDESGDQWYDVVAVLQSLLEQGSLREDFFVFAPSGSALYPVPPSDNPWTVLLHPSGVFWSTTNFTDLVVYLYPAAPPSTAPPNNFRRTDLYEVRFDITINQAPVLTLTAFSGSITTTARPTLQWGYSDPENDTQERVEYRVYSTPAAGWSGFNPDTTTQVPVLTEMLFTTVTSYRVPSIIANGTYRVYARAADAGSQGRFGVWSFVGLTMNVPAPTVPTLTVFDDPAHCRVVATVGVAQATQPFGVTLERQNPDGTWSTVYECDSVVTSGVAGAWHATMYDRTAPRGALLNYRARTWNGDHDLQSAPSATRSTELLPDGKTWLICSFPHDGSLDMACLQLGGNMGDIELEAEDQFAFGPEGRPDMVVVHGTIHSARSEADIAFGLVGDAQLKAWRAIRAVQVPVLVKGLQGDGPLLQRWMTFGTPAKRTALGCAGPRNLQLYRMEVPWFTTSQPTEE